MLDELRAMEDRILADDDARERYVKALIDEVGSVVTSMGTEPCATLWNDASIEMTWYSASQFLIELVRLTPEQRLAAARKTLEAMP